MGLENEVNYYDLLEVSPAAGDQQIWSAYHRLRDFYANDPKFQREFSPDEADAILKLLDEAYQTLRDPVRREAYDHVIHKLWPPDAPSRHLPDFIEDEATPLEPSEDISSARASAASISSIENEVQAHYPIPQGGVDGEYIKTLRQDAGLSCDEVGAITRIAVHHIESVEADNIDNLPAPVFVRGFITQIAKTFGLDEKLVTDSYMERFKRLRSK